MNPDTNPTVTAEELLALTKSADSLRQQARNWMEIAEQFRACCRNEYFYRDLLDAVAIHLGKEAYTADDGNVHDLPLRVKIPGLVAKLVRENETLARNVPPEPPVETALHEMRDEIVKKTAEAWLQDAPGAPYEVKMTDVEQIGDWNRIATTRVIGQAWCQTESKTPCLVGIYIPCDFTTVHVVLCEVHQDMRTGALTYRPLAVEDLPHVP